MNKSIYGSRSYEIIDSNETFCCRLQEIEGEFEKHVSVKDITRKYDVDPEGLEHIYNYWVLKRRASFNKPLLAAKSEDASDLLNKNQEQVDQEKMRMFVQLRQDLERVSIATISKLLNSRANTPQCNIRMWIRFGPF